jgi:hypothetical protein
MAAPVFVQHAIPARVAIAGTTTMPLAPKAARLGFTRVDTTPAPNPLAARNQSAVIDMCRDYVEAQFQYFRMDQDRDGLLSFAERIRSTPGKHDGLHWPLVDDEDESPIGPKFAAAAITEKPAADKPRPLFGYYFKTLSSQGPEAPGGARDYKVEGRLVTGFGLLAWPAEYGVSGVQSFQVNHLGDVYAKDLGPATHRIAAGMPAFAPDRTWKKVASTADYE